MNFIHELVLHVAVVMARVMFWMGGLVMFWMGVLMVNRLCCFLRLRFQWLCGPLGPDHHADQPHVGCEMAEPEQLFSLRWFVMLSVKLAPTATVNTSLCNSCVHVLRYSTRALDISKPDAQHG